MLSIIDCWGATCVRACEAFAEEGEFGVWLQASRARQPGAGHRTRAILKGGGAGNGLRGGGGTCEGRASSKGGVGGGESEVMNAVLERQGGEDCAWSSSGLRVSECSLLCS